MNKLKTYFFISILLLCFPELVLSQNLFQGKIGTTGNESGYAIINTLDGNIILVGSSMLNEFAPTNGIIIKLNTNGDTIWSKVYSPNLIFKDIIALANGGYFISGESKRSTGSSDYFFMKVNPYGDSLWTKIYGGDQLDLVESIQATADNGFVALCRTGSYGFDNYGAMQLLKLDSLGAIVWDKILPQYYVVNSIVQNIDGSCVVFGVARTQGVSDFCISKFDVLGNLVWSRAYQGEFVDDQNARKIIKLENGNYLVAGYIYRYQNIPASLCVIFCLDDLGNIVWNRSYSSGYDNQLTDLIQTHDKGFAIIGIFAPAYDINNIYNDYFLIKTDSLGNFLWSKSYGGSNMDNLYSISEGLDSSLYLLGESNSSGLGGGDIFLVKTDNQGNTSCNEIPISTSEANIIFVEQSVTHTISNSYNQYFKSISTESGISILDACNPTLVSSIFFNKNTISAFPNPLKNSVNVTYCVYSECDTEDLLLEVVNLLGDVIEKRILMSNQGVVQLNLNLSSGLYLVRLKSRNDILANQKIVILN